MLDKIFNLEDTLCYVLAQMTRPASA